MNFIQSGDSSRFASLIMFMRPKTGELVRVSRSDGGSNEEILESKGEPLVWSLERFGDGDGAPRHSLNEGGEDANPR